MDLGLQIRSRRVRQQLTLAELATRSGVSRAMLSAIERGTKNPTITVVCRIAAGLACSVSELLQPVVQPAIHVQRHAEQQVLVDPRSGVERRSVSSLLMRHGVEVVMYRLPAGQSTGAFPAHRPGTLEQITLLEGVLNAQLGAEVVQLAAGDAVSFPADIIHSFANPGPVDCHYLLVIDGSHVAATG